MAEPYKYIVYIDIKRVVQTGTIVNPTTGTEEVAQVVVGADNLTDVAYKAKQHLELIAESA